MQKWTDPRYADVMRQYTVMKPAKPKLRKGWSKRPYGDGFVIVIDPATLTPYTARRGSPSS
ncbi:hypothetical protein ACIRQP_26130 [Streptomyces sp. NPDC102274]|uniref:hypothetical protein n=1 Tax=Streptomyces sp. NPDC102274 TaxID=3366151 RepID=UPI0037F1299A